MALFARRIHFTESTKQNKILFNNRYDKGIEAIPERFRSCIISFSRRKNGKPVCFMVYWMLEMGSDFPYSHHHYYYKLYNTLADAMEQVDCDVEFYYDEETSRSLVDIAIFEEIKKSRFIEFFPRNKKGANKKKSKLIFGSLADIMKARKQWVEFLINEEAKDFVNRFLLYQDFEDPILSVAHDFAGNLSLKKIEKRLEKIYPHKLSSEGLKLYDFIYDLFHYINEIYLEMKYVLKNSQNR